MLPANKQGNIHSNMQDQQKGSSSSLRSGLKDAEAGTRSSLISSDVYQKGHNHRLIKPNAKC